MRITLVNEWELSPDSLNILYLDIVICDITIIGIYIDSRKVGLAIAGMHLNIWLD